MIVNGYNITSRANLRGANLYRANLYRADLRGADLRGADLRGANLYGADLRGAIGVIDGGYPLNYRVVVVQHDDGVRIHAGCRWFTFAKAVEHWTNHTKDRRAMIAFLDYAATAVMIKGWKL